jgi:squalene-associated FAD-dependent desaturase
MRVAIVGGGWAGMAAAVAAARAGAQVEVFEAGRTLGGRARALTLHRPDGQALTLDNGQHILIGAYTQALTLMESVGVDLGTALLQLPLGLPFPDGTGLQTPRWAARCPPPLDALAAIATAKGWSWPDRLALLQASLSWRMRRFQCPPDWSVARLCRTLPSRPMTELIEPLCVSALNMPPAQASAQVFLQVMRDALFGQGHRQMGPAHLLLPRVDLSAAFPEAARQWLAQQHPRTTTVHIGVRVLSLARLQGGWCLHTDAPQGPKSEPYDRVILATAASPAAQLVRQAASDADPDVAHAMNTWATLTDALAFTAITTVYAWAPGAALRSPMLALRPEPDAHAAPAQFVFDRGALQPGHAVAQGVLAFVVSASQGEREDLQARVMQQAARQLNLHQLQPIRTVTDKRATFACTPALRRPDTVIAPGLWAAGDYVDGPYPATLEGAVRSGQAAASALGAG